MRLLLITICFLVFGASLSAQTVYTTKTGEKYHTKTCRYLKHSQKSISLEKALELGYEPCSVCKPPKKIEKEGITSKNNLKSEDTETSSNKKTTSTQCSSKTKAGSRCKRMTKNANGRCYQHQ